MKMKWIVLAAVAVLLFLWWKKKHAATGYGPDFVGPLPPGANY